MEKEEEVLPVELWVKICLYLEPQDLYRLILTSPFFVDVLNNTNVIWESVAHKKRPYLPSTIKQTWRSYLKTKQTWLKAPPIPSLTITHTDAVNSVGYDSSLNLLVTGSRDKTALLYSLDSNKELHRFTSTGFIHQAFFHPESHNVITAGWFLHLWDYKTGELITQFEGHSEDVMCVALSTNNSNVMFSTGDDDGTINVWDIAKGELMKKIQASEEPVEQVRQLSANRLVTYDMQGLNNSIFDIETGNQEFILEESSSLSLNFYARDDVVIAYTTRGIAGTLVPGLWDLRVAESFNGETRSLKPSFEPLATGHNAFSMIAFDAESGCYHNGYRVAGVGGSSIKFWDFRQNRASMGKHLLQEAGGFALRFCGGNAIIGSPDGGLVVADEINGVGQQWRPHSDTISWLCDLDGERFASASYDHTVQVWSKNTT